LHAEVTSVSELALFNYIPFDNITTVERRHKSHNSNTTAVTGVRPWLHV